tara:strand:- start:881 stop:1867 length:987 start_codon:yes stop_codon:yes gene_type:complete
MAGFKYYAGSHEIAQYASNTSECNNGSGIVLPKNSYLHFDNGFDGNPQDSHNALVIRKNTLGFGIISDTSTSLSTNNTNATGSTASTGSNCCDQIQIVYEDFNQNDYSDGKQPYKKYRITYYAQPNDTGGFAAYKRVEHYSQPRNGCDLIAQATPPPQNDGGNDPLGDGNLFNLENQFGVNRDPNAGGIVGSGVSDDSADVSSINKGLWLTDCNECTPGVMVRNYIDDMEFIPFDQDGKIIQDSAGKFPAPEHVGIRDRLLDIRGVDIRLTWISKEDFYKDAATTDKPRTILGLGGADRNNLISDGKDKKLRDSVVVTVHTRNIGETF